MTNREINELYGLLVTAVDEIAEVRSRLSDDATRYLATSRKLRQKLRDAAARAECAAEEALSLITPFSFIGGNHDSPNR